MNVAINFDALILMPFTKEATSLQAKPGKHKLHLSALSLTSKNPLFEALTHNLYLCAYSDLQNTLKIHLIYAFGSAHVKIGV